MLLHVRVRLAVFALLLAGACSQFSGTDGNGGPGDAGTNGDAGGSEASAMPRWTQARLPRVATW
jgi:hypothetical protein